MQFPSHMPTTLANGPEVKKEVIRNAEGGVVEPEYSFDPEGPGALGKLPPGYMGELLVFKSGRCKMRLGEILLDVSQG